MEVSFVHLLLLCLFGLCFPPSHQQSDSCGAEPPVKHLIPFNASSFHCSVVWAKEDFVLRYKNTEANGWSFILSAPDTGSFVAVGFSDGGSMVGSSAVVGWVSRTGKGTVKQYHLGGKSPDACTPDKGSLTLVKNKAVVVSHSSRLYLAFQLSTDRPKTHLIYAVGPNGDLPSANSFLPVHRDKVSRSINYTSGVSSNGGDGGSDTAFPPERKHGLLAMMGWGVLLPVGMVVARYFRHQDPQWFYGHIVIQTAGFTLGVAAVVLGFRLNSAGIKNFYVHRTLGIAILAMGSLQVMAFLARPDKKSKVRRFWNWYHHNIGRAAVACAVANVFLGLTIAQEVSAYTASYGVFIAVWVVAVAAFEIKRCFADDDDD